MTRRMFFLFPDRHHAEAALHDLEQAGVERDRVHALAKAGIDLGELPRANRAQATDRLHHWERRAWNANQLLFWGAFAIATIAAFNGSTGWLLAMVAVMIAAFVVGLLDIRLPTTHLEQLRGAIDHGEIVMMVDQPMTRVPEVERLIHRHHPEAAVAGVGWTIEALER